MRKKSEMIMILAAAFFLIFAFLTLGLSAEPKNETMLFSTWKGFEPDKCASVWLIRRFIHPEAEFRFYPKGTDIEHGTPFDTPDAAFRRYHNMSTYESLMKHYGIKDPKAEYIGRLIHDIEINVWGRKAFPETEGVMKKIYSIISEHKTDIQIIEESSVYFNRLYDKISIVE